MAVGQRRLVTQGRLVPVYESQCRVLNANQMQDYEDIGPSKCSHTNIRMPAINGQ